MDIPSLALKRDQLTLWSENPMFGLYALKFEGEIIGESLTTEEETEEAELVRDMEGEQIEWRGRRYILTTPSATDSSGESDYMSYDSDFSVVESDTMADGSNSSADEL
jgi:hypothetical protein